MLTLSNKVTINKTDRYYPAILAWCEANLVLKNPDYEKKERMGLWLGKTPRYITMYGMSGDKLIMPYGARRHVSGHYSPGEIYEDFAKNEPVEIGGGVNLYDYQETALKAMLGATNGILVSPAGSGKTQIAIALIKQLGLKTLWLTNKADLLGQSRDRFKTYCQCNIGTITGGKVNIGDVTFATVQTMCKMDLPAYAYEWDLIIVDECHGISSATQIAMFLKVLNNLKAPRKYGLTAVLHRADGLEKGVIAMLGDVVCEIPRSAVSEKTVNPVIRRVDLDTPKSFSYLGTDGTLNFTKLVNYLACDVARTAQIVAQIADNADCGQLVLSDRLDHLKLILHGLAECGLGDIAVMIDGSMTSKAGKLAREQAIEDMRTGKKKILLASFSLAKEGLDIPVLSRLHITTPVKDMSVVIQAVGRVSRVYDGKPDPVVYDYIDENIGYCLGAIKKRTGHYRKIQCRFE